MQNNHCCAIEESYFVDQKWTSNEIRKKETVGRRPITVRIKNTSHSITSSLRMISRNFTARMKKRKRKKKKTPKNKGTRFPVNRLSDW